MELNAQDIITALSNQRNAALNENAQLFAMVEAQKRLLEKFEKTAGDSVKLAGDALNMVKPNA